MLVIGILATAVISFSIGYFYTVSWTVLAEAVLRTTYRLAAAYGIAVVLGVTIALLVGWSPFMDLLFPVFDTLQNIPSFALFPLFIYALGYTDLMIILFAVTSIIWPILFAVLTAIRGAHRDLHDAAIIFGAEGWRYVTYYLAPIAFPAILTGSIVGIAIGWEAVIGSEIIANTGGFGAFIESAGATGLTPSAVAGAVGILIIVFTVNRLVWAPLLSDSSRRYAD
jgi:ABC-type nitrate/sulfonate/bicarbonate transport system permease component